MISTSVRLIPEVKSGFHSYDLAGATLNIIGIAGKSRSRIIQRLASCQPPPAFEEGRATFQGSADSPPGGAQHGNALPAETPAAP